MPRCPKCGKKFDSLQALNDHFKAMHPDAKFVAPKATMSRNLMIGLVVVIIVIGSVVGGLIYTSRTSTTSTTTSTSLLGQPISVGLYQNLTEVSFSTLDQIGSGGSGVAPPTPISSSQLMQGTKHEILYIGAEFCPYCAAERWSLVVALSKFGNFTGLEYMQSGADDGNIATLTFVNAKYNSSNISFVTVENEDRNHNALQNPTSAEQALWEEYTPNPSQGLSYPFIDIGGQYDLTSSQFSYGDLSNMNWTQIASQLNSPSSPTAQVIDGAANTLITAICKITSGSPSSVCSEPFADVSYVIPSSSVVQQAMQAIVPIQEPATMRLGKHLL